MANLLDYATFSALVYWDARKNPANVTPLSGGTNSIWREIAYDTGNSISGFTAGAYQNTLTNEIVIAFKGTDFSSSSPGQTAADIAADLALGGGAGAFQLFRAVKFYEQIKAQNPGSNITFTGHSLGGGLASLMSVYFNRPATTFAEAPFLLTAVNPVIAGYIGLQLSINGFADSDFASFLGSMPFSVGLRSSNVQDYFVSGEVLSPFRGPLSAIYGSDTAIAVGGGNAVSSVDLHSVNLTAALLMQDKLRADTVALPNLLAEIFDTKVYARDLFGKERDFLTGVLNDQIRVGYTNVDGMLARFATDIDKLTQYGTNLKDGALGKALIDIAIADYYFMQSGFTHDFYNAISGGIAFDLSNIGTGWASNKTVGQLDTALVQQLNLDTQARSFLAQDNAWTIQSGTDALIATGTGSNNDAMIGGTSDDILDGGAGNDFLYGGNGADTLTGGTGDDLLIGGAGNDTLDGGTGNDTYIIESSDTLRDSDGLGIIKDSAGNLISGIIEKHTDGTYTYLNDPTVSVSKDTNLTLTMADGSVAVIENFQSGYLGLRLADTAIQTPATNTILTTDTGYRSLHLGAELDNGSFTPVTDSYGTPQLSYPFDGHGNPRISVPWYDAPCLTAELTPASDYVIGSGGEDYIYVQGDGGNDIPLWDAANDSHYQPFFERRAA